MGLENISKKYVEMMEKRGHNFIVNYNEHGSSLLQVRRSGFSKDVVPLIMDINDPYQDTLIERKIAKKLYREGKLHFHTGYNRFIKPQTKIK